MWLLTSPLQPSSGYEAVVVAELQKPGYAMAASHTGGFPLGSETGLPGLA
jgi:hypothetical protein